MGASKTPAAKQGAKFDAVKAAKGLSKAKTTPGSELFVQTGETFASSEDVLRTGDRSSKAYIDALVKVSQGIVNTSGYAIPPNAALHEGINHAATSKQRASTIPDRIKWLCFRNRTGFDGLWFSKDPDPVELLQQITLGQAAVADPSCLPDAPRTACVEVLEDAFQLLATPRSADKYKRAFDDALQLDFRLLQFGVMRMLCVLYRELLEGDRLNNCKYLFRHDEASGICITLLPTHYAGYLENAWNSIQKAALGAVHVTEESWKGARDTAAHGVSLAMQRRHDFAFVPVAYSLAFLMAVGMPGGTVVRKHLDDLLADIATAEERLDAWGLKDIVTFDHPHKRWMKVIRKELKAQSAAEQAKHESKRGKAKRRADNLARAAAESAQAVRSQEEMPEGHQAVIDWRVFDQRFFPRGTWFEPPLQKELPKCTNCNMDCYKIHRCPRCKLTPYCGAVCCQAHLFEHECEVAPKPWLSPPVAEMSHAPKELGEEGFMGVIPWWIVRYAAMSVLVWIVVKVLTYVNEYSNEKGIGRVDALRELGLIAIERFLVFSERLLSKGKGAGEEPGGNPDASLSDLAQSICGDEPDCSASFEETGEFDL